MKLKFYLPGLILFTLIFSCKLTDDVKPYDATNKVFRVIAYYQDEPYDITINQVKANSAVNPYSVLNTTQNSNFEFGFTPGVGDTIKVSANSKKGSFTVFAHYLGNDLGKITLQPDSNNEYSAEFVYVIPN